MSHKLPSISWRPRKMCIIQSESKGLKTRGVNDVNPSPRAREDEMNCPWSNSDTQKKGWIRPFSISCSFPSLSGSICKPGAPLGSCLTEVDGAGNQGLN